MHEYVFAFLAIRVSGLFCVKYRREIKIKVVGKLLCVHVCVCQHVWSCTFVQKHVYIPQAVKDSVSRAFSLYVFILVLAFCACVYGLW